MIWRAKAGSGDLPANIRADGAIGGGRVLLWSNQPDDQAMDIQAITAASGKPAWSTTEPHVAGVDSPGFLARDVYLVGALDGKVRAYRAGDGRKIWTSSETGPIASALAVAGDALYFGVGTPRNLNGSNRGGGVFAFSLNPGH
jgi:outer membrane protein assembly factor BamB